MSESKKDRGETWIGIFKLVKAALFLALAAGAVSVIHHDVQEVVAHRIRQFGFDPDDKYFQKVIDLLGFATTKKVELFSAASFCYGALFLTEGIGLVLHKRWALYVTVIITASFLPVEVYELWKEFTWFRLAILALNIFFLIYLYIRIGVTRKEKK